MSHPNRYSFEEHGFIIIANVFYNYTLLSIRKLTDRIISHGGKGFEEPFSKYCLNYRVD